MQSGNARSRGNVELYRRESGGWGGYILNQPDDLVELSCLSLRLTLGEIYDGIELPSGIAEPEPLEYALGFERDLTESGSPPNQSPRATAPYSNAACGTAF